MNYLANFCFKPFYLKGVLFKTIISKPFKNKIMKTQTIQKTKQVLYIIATVLLFHTTLWVINYVVYHNQF